MNQSDVQPVEVTRLLESLRTGDVIARDVLLRIVYDELHVIASRLMRQERPGHTLQATALVNEVYCKLVTSPVGDWKDRAHFFAVAAQCMRRTLVDHARSRLAGRRGAGAARVSIDSTAVFSEDRLDELLVLEDALDALEREDPRALKVVTMRFYGGLSTEEVAEVLEVSTRTVKRDWNFGRIWLKAYLGSSPDAPQ